MEELTDKQQARNEIDAVLAKYGVSLYDLYSHQNPLDRLNCPDLPKIPRFPYDLTIG